MSHTYKAVQWVPVKKSYDFLLWGSVALYLVLFVGISKATSPYADDMVVLMRAFGTAAFLLLHIVLATGPLARLNQVFLVLHYNRRHMGVTMFLLGLLHAALAIFYYHVGGVVNPITNIFLHSPFTGDLAWIPFQAFGAIALFILFLMAATSHDFWLANLTAPVWKALHMLVYVAYTALVIHVALGILQTEQAPAYAVLTIAGTVVIGGLHLAASRKGAREDKTMSDLPSPEADGFVQVGKVDEIEDNRAKIVTLSGERVAVFKYFDEDDNDRLKISAVSNVCQHQNGPLGEGKYTHGCITCPWHSFQYKPQDGAAPAPFTEKVPTFNVRVVDNAIFVHPVPNPPGRFTEPATLN
jgi:sulfoxide reductase heme-binding subunit YedZ